VASLSGFTGGGGGGVDASAVLRTATGLHFDAIIYIFTGIDLVDV